MRLRRQKDDGLAVRRVLVATDRSETAERAVRFASDMAKRYEAELVLLRVLLSDDGTLAEAGRELAEHAREVAGDSGRSAVVVAEAASAYAEAEIHLDRILEIWPRIPDAGSRLGCGRRSPGLGSCVSGAS